MVKRMNPRFEKVDPLSLRFSSQWESQCDEAQKLGMYRAAFRSFRISQLGFLGAFAVCAFTELFYPLGLMPFLLITVFWGLHSLSFDAGFIADGLFDCIIYMNGTEIKRMPVRFE